MSLGEFGFHANKDIAVTKMRVLVCILRFCKEHRRSSLDLYSADRDPESLLGSLQNEHIDAGWQRVVGTRRG